MAIVAATLALPMAGSAATYNWTPTAAGSYNWNGPHWNPAGVPNAATDVVNFTSNILGLQAITLNQNATVGVVNIGDPNGSASYSILSNGFTALTMDNGAAAARIVHNAASAADEFGAAMFIPRDLDIVNNASTALTVSGNIYSDANSGTQTVNLTGVSGSVINLSASLDDGFSDGQIAVTYSGSGTLRLGGSNVHTGGVTLNSGTLEIDNGSALGSSESVFRLNGGILANTSFSAVVVTQNNPQIWATNVTFNGISDLDLGGGQVTMTANRIVTVNGPNLAVRGGLTDNGSSFSLRKTGTGILTLGGDSTYTGGTFVDDGIMRLASGGAVGTNQTITVASGKALELEGDIVVNPNTLILTGHYQINTGALRNLSGDNTWTGDIQTNAYSETISPTETRNHIVRIVSVSGTLTIDGNILTNSSLTNATVFQGNGVVNGVISGPSPVTKGNADEGVWTFNNANTYSGVTTISNGAIRLGHRNAIPTNSGVLLGSSGISFPNALQFASGVGEFDILSIGQVSGSTAGFSLEDTLGLPVNVNLTSNVNVTTSVPISGPGTITKLGLASTLTLSNRNTFNGLIVKEGVVSSSDSLVYTGGFTDINAPIGNGTVTLHPSTTLNVSTNGESNSTTQILQVGNNVNALGAATLNINRQGGSGTGKFVALGDLTVAAGVVTLAPSTTNNYTVTFNDTRLTGNANLNATGTVILIGDVEEDGTPRSLTKSGSGRLILNADANYTGDTTVSAGTLEVRGSISGSTTVSSGTLEMRGDAAGTVANSGSVVFNPSRDRTTGIVVSGTGTLTKAGTNTLTLTAPQQYTGVTTISGGRLVLEYAGSGTQILPGTALTTSGEAYLKGASSGSPVVQNIGALAIPAATRGRFILDNNGGPGVTLNITGAWTGNTSSSLHFDLRNGGAVTTSSSLSVTNNVLILNGAARVVVTNSSGQTYLATRVGTNIVPQTTLTNLPTSGASNTTNYQLTGDLTSTGPLTTASLRIAPASGPLTFNISAGNFTTAAVGWVVDGTHDVTIDGNAGGGTIGNAVIHHYNTGVLTINAPMGADVTKAGPGFMIANYASALGGSGNTTVMEGIYRLGNANAMGVGLFTLSGGAILELGAGDMSRVIGTSAGQIRLLGDAGFSAFGGTRAVSVGTGTVTWDTTNFLPGNSALVLSSSRSDSTVDFQTPLALGNLIRTFLVNEGSAPIDAQVSAPLSGWGGIEKRGPGALALSAANTFHGPANVLEGTLIVNGSLVSPVNVSAGILRGHGDGLTTGLISGAITIGDGAGEDDSVLSPGNSIGLLTTSGSLSLLADSKFHLELDSSQSIADKMVVTNGISIAADAEFEGFDLAVASIALPWGTSFTVLDNLGLNPISGAFANLLDGAWITIGANIFEANYDGADGNDLVLTVVPEPSTGLLLAGGLAALAWRRRRPRQARF